MSDATVRISMVNHASVDIACKPEAVWRDIVEFYVEGRKFSEQGYTIEPLTDDLAAVKGGYRMWIHGAGGEIADERICRVTERDERAMRLSVAADYLVPASTAMVVQAGYQAVPIASGARYELHAHSSLNLPRPTEGDAKAQIARTVAEITRQSDEYLNAFLLSIKMRLEGAQ